MRISPFRVSLFALICALAAVPASASPVTPYEYSYVISIPTLGGTSGATLTLDWAPVPLNPQGTGGAIYSSLTGSPESGYSLADYSWTIAYDPTTAVYDSEIFAEFEDGSNDYIAYTFIEPESFWDTAGTDLSFPVGDTVTDAFLQWPDPALGTPVYGATTTGANYTTFTDPPCTGCSIDIAATPYVTPIPEPSSILLLGSGLAGLAGMIRRKIVMRR
jgi:hypothetical protein